MNSTFEPVPVQGDPSISDDGPAEGFAGIGKLILAFVLSTVALITQQMILWMVSLVIYTSTSTSSWELRHGEVIIDGERRMSMFELPTAGSGIVWGSLAGIAIILLGGYFLGGRSFRAFNFRAFTWRSLRPWLIAVIALVLIGHWAEQNYAEFQSKVMESMIQAGRPTLFLMILGMGILVPIFEELVFRGVLFKYIARCWGGMVALITTSVLFTVVHMQYNIFILVFILLIALLLGMMRLKTGSIWPGILVHSVNNTISIVAVLYFS